MTRLSALAVLVGWPLALAALRAPAPAETRLTPFVANAAHAVEVDALVNAHKDGAQITVALETPVSPKIVAISNANHSAFGFAVFEFARCIRWADPSSSSKGV